VREVIQLPLMLCARMQARSTKISPVSSPNYFQNSSMFSGESKGLTHDRFPFRNAKIMAMAMGFMTTDLIDLLLYAF
jgi:hypothetical protein